jgi:hypothetical protein
VEQDAIWLYRYVIQLAQNATLASEYRQRRQADGVHLADDGHVQVNLGLKRAANLLGLQHLLRFPR